MISASCWICRIQMPARFDEILAVALHHLLFEIFLIHGILMPVLGCDETLADLTSVLFFLGSSSYDVTS